MGSRPPGAKELPEGPICSFSNRPAMQAAVKLKAATASCHALQIFAKPSMA